MTVPAAAATIKARKGVEMSSRLDHGFRRVRDPRTRRGPKGSASTAYTTTHSEQFRDSQTERRLAESPHLESRDEYELSHDTGTPHLESRAEYEHPHARTPAR